MSPPLDLVFAQPIEAHVRLWAAWRSDPETRAASVHGEEWPLDIAWQEYMHRLRLLPDAPPVFLMQEGSFVAFLDFRPITSETSRLRKACECSIVVAPEHRHQGIGLQGLQQAKEFLRHRGYDDVYATIKEENLTSQKLFLKAGWNRVGETTRGESVPLNLYHLPLAPAFLSKEHAVFVIAEVGSNWKMETEEESWHRVRELIREAARAGADAVKFQTFRPETLYASGAGKSGYLRDSGIETDMSALFESLAMPYDLLPRLAEVCQEEGVLFLSTPFSVNDFDAVDPYVAIHKLASYEIGHLRLIQKMAVSGKPLLMSTGAAMPDEIRWAVDTFRAHGGKDLFLLQCTAKYPAPLETLNLQAIPWLKQTFGTGVGLSDHSREPLYGPLAAVALGARVVEKHFTLEDDVSAPDKPVSIFPRELKELVDGVRAVEQALGSGRKTVLDVEEELRTFARRGVQALCVIKKGDLLEEDRNIGILRPGNHPLGVHPRYLDELQGQTALRDIAEGEGIQDGDW